MCLPPLPLSPVFVPYPDIVLKLGLSVGTFLYKFQTKTKKAWTHWVIVLISLVCFIGLISHSPKLSVISKLLFFFFSPTCNKLLKSTNAFAPMLLFILDHNARPKDLLILGFLTSTLGDNSLTPHTLFVDYVLRFLTG